MVINRPSSFYFPNCGVLLFQSILKEQGKRLPERGLFLMAALLETRNLTKSLSGRVVIDRLNLNVMEGDVYGFLGRNGQGKTTMIRLMTGLVQPDCGNVLIGGYDLKKNFRQAIAQVGAIVESPSFYGYLSGYDNLALMANLIPGLKKNSISETLDMVGLVRRAKDKVKTYSLGMKQRLGIANAL